MTPHSSALQEQVSFGAMIWLAAAQLAVIGPFLLQVQMLVLPVLLFCVGWRMAALRGRVGKPGAAIKSAVFLGVIALVATVQPVSLGLDTMITLLLLSFAFKSIEVENRRDALVVIWVAYFLLAASFLYDQSIGAGLYGLLAMLCVTTCLLAVQNPGLQITTRRRAMIAGGLLLNCVPLVALIFVVTPRLPPLWHMPELGNGATTGVSDSMTPGDIANLSQSDRLAFRASFAGPRPAQEELYWRGMALNHFDGTTWRAFDHEIDPAELRLAMRQLLPAPRHRPTPQSRTVNYELLLEPSGQPWLFTLGALEDIEPAAVLGFDFRAIAEHPIDAPQIVRAQSTLDAQRDPELPAVVRELALQLPDSGNPRARQLARELRVQAGSAERYIEQVLARYTELPFHYTLRPPPMGDTDTIDRFLFDAQRGFCAHYAGSFVFLMRAAGIPARTVVGYQGGEWHPDGAYFAVRNYDAHAWTEVWLPQEGWRRIDPTARVAPERVEQNLRSAVRDEGSFLADSPFAMARYDWLSSWRQRWDRAQYQWRRTVIGFDARAQLDLLQRLLGELSPGRTLLAALGAMAAILVLLVLASGSWRDWLRRVPPEQRLRHRLIAELARQGLPPRPGQSLRELTASAAARWPAQADALAAFAQHHDQLLYAPDTDRKVLLRRMRGALRQLRGRWEPAAEPALMEA